MAELPIALTFMMLGSYLTLALWLHITLEKKEEAP